GVRAARGRARPSPPGTLRRPHGSPLRPPPAPALSGVGGPPGRRGGGGGALAEALPGPAEFTSGEVARAAGVELDDARRLWQALGFPPVPDDDHVFTRADVEVLRTARALIEQQDTDPVVLVQLARVTGQALARIADAQLTASAERLERARTAGAPADIAFAALAARIDVLARGLEQMLGYVWRRHLVAALLRLSTAPDADRIQTVAFADLVGFTAMSQALDPRELSAKVDRFEAIAYEQIPARGGRVVKMIGD